RIGAAAACNLPHGALNVPARRAPWPPPLSGCHRVAVRSTGTARGRATDRTPLVAGLDSGGDNGRNKERLMPRPIHELLEEVEGLRAGPGGQADRGLGELHREAERLDIEMRARPTVQNADEVELDFARFEDRLRDMERRV